MLPSLPDAMHIRMRRAWVCVIAQTLQHLEPQHVYVLIPRDAVALIALGAAELFYLFEE
jgi:hypothetical protein